MLPGHIHLVGIGGAGMAGLAQFLLRTGRRVSGSDIARSPASEALAAAGAVIAIGHDTAWLGGAELLVASDAIPAGNLELEAARERGLPVLRRAECLDLLAEGRPSVLVAGSHGKSTTAAMIACVLEWAGTEPGFVVGADIPALGDIRGRPGAGRFVAEACEAFRNLECYHPGIAVITNIDDEHVNHYASQTALDMAFAEFAARAETVILSGEDAGAARIRPVLGAVTTFGLDPACDISAPAEPAPFTLRVFGEAACTVVMRLPGDHMRRNALAAAAACRAAGIGWEEVANGLARFTGAARRWQDIGTTEGVRIIDDYAHHPAEIAATLRAARGATTLHPGHGAGGRVVAALQPLLHSRVARLSAEFAASLALADLVLLQEVDAAGEVGRSGGSAAIARALYERSIPLRRYADADELVAQAPAELLPGDLVVVMGGRGMEGVATRLHQRLARPSPTAPARRRWSSRLADRLRAPTTVVDLVRAAARTGPDDAALIDGSGTMSYAALDAASDAVAASLAARGLHGRAVGVSLPQSAELVIAMLGVMKAAATYLPLDPSLPEARKRFMLHRGDAAALITRDAAPQAVPKLGTTVLDLAVLDLAVLRAGAGTVPPAPSASGSAYLCFTSGSTGEPKGIRVGHAALFALLRDIVPRFGLGPGTRMAFNTSISFDVSLAELCGTLAGGGALVVGGSRPLVGERLAALLEAREITHLSVTPTVLASVAPRSLPSLGCIIACGEACPPALVADWAPGRRFFNVYGPTEATVYATAALCQAGTEITIGTPLAHLQAQVLDAALNPVPAGTLGELCLAGAGLAEGYIGQPEETAARFVPTGAGRTYRTGDMVRLGADGALRFVGRVDDQVKIRGNRVELAEIEQAARRHPGIADAAVCVEASERRSLVCFVLPEAGAVPDLVELSAALAAWLPDSAVPSHVVSVPAMPLTPSGKKDRRRLLGEHRARIVSRASDFAPPRTETEARVAALWRSVLKLEFEVGMLDRFAALGGDSLAGLILVAEIEAAFGVAVPPGYFGRVSTVPQMTVQLAELLWHRDGHASIAAGFRGSRIYRQLRDLCGHWPGTRANPDCLITTLGGAEATYDLVICLQMEEEFAALGRRLPAAFRLHAMRSGHLVIDQGPASLRQLAAHYADEIEQLDPPGTLVLGGVCQGVTIAQMVAELLAARGRRPALLVAIEPGRPTPYDGPVAVFHSEDSFLNPLRPGGPGSARLDAALTGGYTLDLVPGNHGGTCVEPAVRFLAHHLVHRVEEAARQPAPTP